MLLHDFATLMETSVRLILSVAASFLLCVGSLDLTQAYVLGMPTTRMVPVKHDPNLGVSPGSFFQLLRSLCGLEDEGHALWRSIRTFVTNAFNLSQ